MKKGDILSKKLLAYPGLASAILCGVKNVGAQIVYHDVVPDYGLQCEYGWDDYYNIDLNNNGINDLQISHSSWSGYGGDWSWNNGAFGGYINDFVSQMPLNSGDTIDQNLQWQGNIIMMLVGNNYTEGYWFFRDKKFLPVKLVIAGHDYFGWVRMTTGNKCIYVLDYGISTIPDQPIIAGDTSLIATTIQNVSSDNEAPKILEQNSSLLIIFPQPLSSLTQFTVVDMIGRMKYQSTALQSTKEISITDLEAGEYLLSVGNEKSKTVFRFFKN